MIDVEQVTCHDCGAEPGEGCKRENGAAASRPHRGRIAAAREEFA